jgi:hypothetical protein
MVWAWAYDAGARQRPTLKRARMCPAAHRRGSWEIAPTTWEESPTTLAERRPGMHTIIKYTKSIELMC